MRRIFPVFAVVLLLFAQLSEGQQADRPAPQPARATESGQAASGEAQAASEAPPSVDDFGVDMDLEVRVVLGAKTGLAGALPPDLIDMRQALQKRFNYATYSLWNTMHVVAWPGESTVVQIVPEHYLVVEPLAADAERGIVKARVGVYREHDQGETIREFAATNRRAYEIARNPRVPQDVRYLLSSPMTVVRDEWKTVGGVELFLSADGQQLMSSSSSSTSILGSAQSRVGAVKRYLIVGVTIAE